MHYLYHRLCCLGRCLSSRSFAASFLFAALAAMMITTASLINTICINDEGKTLMLRTTEQDPYTLLEENGIITLSTDIVHFTGIEGGYGEINITRSFPVTVSADGRSKTLYVTDGTVQDALTELGIEYDSNDLLSPDPEKTLEENEVIVLERVDHVTREEELVIPHETETKPSPLLRNGRTITLQSGSDGSKILSYMQRTVDGVVQEEELVGEAVTKAPVTEKLLVGADVPVSPLDFGVATDENGIPLQYSRVLTDQVATGYNMRRSNVRGASGMKLSAGYVAVRADEIPYGTRMYITSSDGSFVYGYAIAADTGVGLMQGAIDVDLYYDTYTESCLNGRRTVNLYILD